jgi:hypothetical protein
MGYTDITSSSKGIYFWYSSDQGYSEADCTSNALASVSNAYPELSGTKSCTSANCNSPFSYVSRFKITAASGGVAQDNVAPVKAVAVAGLGLPADSVTVSIAADVALEYTVRGWELPSNR